MSRFRRTEDMADIWLRQHDPYYTAPEKNKRKRLDYPYDTPEQEKRRREAEIPISNLTSYQKVQLKGVVGSYTEAGEFNLW